MERCGGLESSLFIHFHCQCILSFLHYFLFCTGAFYSLLRLIFSLHCSLYYSLCRWNTFYNFFKLYLQFFTSLRRQDFSGDQSNLWNTWESYSYILCKQYTTTILHKLPPSICSLCGLLFSTLSPLSSDIISSPTIFRLGCFLSLTLLHLRVWRNTLVLLLRICHVPMQYTIRMYVLRRHCYSKTINWVFLFLCHSMNNIFFLAGDRNKKGMSEENRKMM